MKTLMNVVLGVVVLGSLAGCSAGEDPHGWGAGYHSQPYYGYGGGYFGRPYYSFGDGHPTHPYFKYSYGGGFYGGRKSGAYYGPPR